MTPAELAELRGQLFGLEALVANLLSFQAGITDDPISHLEAIQRESLSGIASGRNTDVRPAHLDRYRGAAASVVLRLVALAQTIHIPTEPRDQH